MNLPLSPARWARRSWLRPFCWRSMRRRCPRNFRTWGTARSATTTPHLLDGIASRQSLTRLRRPGHDGEHERSRAAHHRVHAAGGAARIVAGRAGARVVAHAAFQDEDLLLAEVAMPGN